MSYPRWTYYPQWQSPPAWVAQLVAVVSTKQPLLDTEYRANTSDKALEILRPGLVAMGFDVEKGKAGADKLFRPVFFGENGEPARQYEIDAYHPAHRVAFEVEAGRPTMGNAIYRDLIQMSLLVDVDYAVVAVPVSYRYLSGGRQTVASRARGRPATARGRSCGRPSTGSTTSGASGSAGREVRDDYREKRADHPGA